ASWRCNSFWEGRSSLRRQMTERCAIGTRPEVLRVWDGKSRVEVRSRGKARGMAFGTVKVPATREVRHEYAPGCCASRGRDPAASASRKSCFAGWLTVTARRAIQHEPNLEIQCSDCLFCAGRIPSPRLLEGTHTSAIASSSLAQCQTALLDGSNPVARRRRSCDNLMMNVSEPSAEKELRDLLQSDAFSGVVAVAIEGRPLIEFAGGFANRRTGRPNTL